MTYSTYGEADFGTAPTALRVAITVNPDMPVPPQQYGGIERIIDMLACGLIVRGHKVTLFAHPDSRTSAPLSPYPGARALSRVDTVRNLWHVASTGRRVDFDVIHCFSRLAYLLCFLPLSIPKLVSFQLPISPRSIMWGERLSRNTLHFAGCSAHLIRPWTGRPNWHVVYNAAPLGTYEPRVHVSSDAPLVFLGRLEPPKGPHLAIEVAKRAGRRLVLAGPVFEDRDSQNYFEQQIAPHVDGENIQYVGSVNDQQKNELLGTAAALLMPILWEEPFGIVMAEALACGTPVVGLRRGSVPEVVIDGINGFVCDSVDAMVEAISQLNNISRSVCREDMERRFSDRSMVLAYEALYYDMMSERNR